MHLKIPRISITGISSPGLPPQDKYKTDPICFVSIIKPSQGILADLVWVRAFFTDTFVIPNPPTPRRKSKTSLERKTSSFYFFKKKKKKRGNHSIWWKKLRESLESTRKWKKKIRKTDGRFCLLKTLSGTWSNFIPAASSYSRNFSNRHVTANVASVWKGDDALRLAPRMWL